ncbi:NTPase KAP family P-loop domain-containing protein 1 [Astyanax mexicanus]|uniref:NTPase KAP family P-loop domain-containing protein 1 n=1 Tax=Astyanax mexicanus TaxID=7994 RepID=A0A8T2KR32_ASTMX|nr:NTPase KAP family P-loop domain-containing protein 1 [Astyanax mexicanus]
MAKDLYSENIYAYALSKTLTKVHPPLTVGLYSSCHSKIKMILKNIKGHMKDEAQRREKQEQKSKPRPAMVSVGNLLSLISRLLFYRPVWTEQNQNRECVRYVFVKFSAWHFAGSDLLWAGLVMHLWQTLQDSFGKLQLGLYRVAQFDKDEDRKKKKIEDINQNWRSKKVLCIPLWILVLVTLVVSLFVLVSIIILGFSGRKQGEQGQEEGQEDSSKSNGYGVLEGFAIAALGVPAAGAVRFTVILGKNLIFNQDLNIRRRLDNKKISEQLGLMHEVRKEIRLLSRFIHFMEIFERRKIKVVLEITNLDRCTPEKIVGVLDAINILLSDEESPFISLIAVDPEVLAQQVDQAKGCFTKKDRAYGFLDRIITLPFTIPQLCDTSKRKVFQKIVCGQSESTFDSQALEVGRQCETEAAFECIVLSTETRLYTYISENTVSMRRVINSIRVTIVVMEALKVKVPPPERIAAWVVLVDRWPCRLSWILQCVEDEEQILQIEENKVGTPAVFDPNKSLWSVFSEHRVELHVIGDDVERFLERDDDPELFEMFLKNDFKFTVGEMATFKLYTVNLDYSIKNELAKIRGSKRVKGTGRSFFNTLSPKTVINMTVEDICSELSRMNLQEKYSETVRMNHINGQALLLSDPSDLREVMKMTLGEWTAFKTRFLGVMSSGRRNQTKLSPDHQT